jgi:hypothetical protein
MHCVPRGALQNEEKSVTGLTAIYRTGSPVLEIGLCIEAIVGVNYL